MLKKETIQKIAATLKMDAAALESAITDTAEKDIAIPDNITVLTAEELATRDRAKELAGRKAGETASIEMLIKDKKKELGLEFEGKDPDTFIEALQQKALADAKIAPDEKLKEKDKTISQLQKNIQTLQNEKQQIEQKVSQVKVEATVLKSIPSNLKAGMDAEEVLTLMKAKGYDFTEKDGQIVAVKNGETIADQALNPRPIKDVVTEYATERGWIDTGTGTRSGRGEGSSGGGSGAPTKPTKLSDAEKEWVKDGKKTGTADFSRYVDELRAENKEFDLNA